MSDNKTKRDAIILKIRALLSKTEANGCTEAEALAAAEAVDRLLAEYDLTYTDIKAEVGDDKYGARRATFAKGTNRYQPPVASFCASQVAAFFNCKVFSDRDGFIVFFGTKDETELAQQLLALLVLTSDTEVARFLKSPDRPRHIHGRTVRKSFEIGFITRVRERLAELKQARTAATPTGRSLVVVKDQVVTERYASFCRDKGLRLRTTNRKSVATNAASYYAGASAGQRADLGGGKLNSAQLRIGG